MSTYKTDEKLFSSKRKQSQLILIRYAIIGWASYWP